jgi:hypothetical protein
MSIRRGTVVNVFLTDEEARTAVFELRDRGSLAQSQKLLPLNPSTKRSLVIIRQSTVLQASRLAQVSGPSGAWA